MFNNRLQIRAKIEYVSFPRLLPRVLWVDWDLPAVRLGPVAVFSADKSEVHQVACMRHGPRLRGPPGWIWRSDSEVRMAKRHVPVQSVPYLSMHPNKATQHPISWNSVWCPGSPRHRDPDLPLPSACNFSM